MSADPRASTQPIILQPIGQVRSERTEAIDDGWDAIASSIVLDDRFGPEALAGVTEFSHVEVVFCFDLVDEADVQTGSRRPRGNPDWPEVGIFAQRGRVRPNRLGITTCQLVAVEGQVLSVRGLDAVDGTPVLDLKPHVAAFGPRTEVREPSWMAELMAGYW